jgi:hypothetical protein
MGSVLAAFGGFGDRAALDNSGETVLARTQFVD